MAYAAPARAREELYDTQADPHQLVNRANDPAAQEVLANLRTTLYEWLLASHDAGFVNEPDMRRRMGPDGTPLQVARDPQRYPLARLLAAADLVGDAAHADDLAALCRTDDPGLRYWGAVGLNALGDTHTAEFVLHDADVVVRIEAAAAILRQRDHAGARTVLISALDDQQSDVVLHAARALELAGANAAPARLEMHRVMEQARAREAHDTMYLFIRFSLDAALEQFGPSPY